MISPERIGAALAGCALIALSAVGAGAGPAADGTGWSLEMPAHRALMALRNAPDTRLAPFETDGCSGGLSDAWYLVADQLPDLTAEDQEVPVWEPCCVTHDRAYHDAGGATDPAQSYAARLTADRALEACVQATGERSKAEIAARQGISPEQVSRAYAVIAGAMFLAVRFGGAPCSGLPWRWGYGYPDCSVFSGGGAGPGPGN